MLLRESGGKGERGEGADGKGEGIVRRIRFRQTESSRRKISREMSVMSVSAADPSVFLGFSKFVLYQRY